MSDVYKQNAPTDYPGTQAQPQAAPRTGDLQGDPMPLPQIKETVERWKREILDRIQYLKESLDQSLKDKEALQLEADRLKDELASAGGKIRQLEGDLSGVLELYNSLVREVQGALQE